MTLEKFIEIFGDGILDATDAFQDLLDSFPAGQQVELDLQACTLRLSRPVVLAAAGRVVTNVTIMLDGDLAERFAMLPSADMADIFLDGQADSVERWLARREDAAELRQKIREAVRTSSAAWWRMAASAALWITGASLSVTEFSQSSALSDTLRWVMLAIGADLWLRLAAEVRLIPRVLAWIAQLRWGGESR